LKKSTSDQHLQLFLITAPIVLASVNLVDKMIALYYSYCHIWRSYHSSIYIELQFVDMRHCL